MTRNERNPASCGGRIAVFDPAGYLGHTNLGPFHKTCLRSPRQYADLNECVSNRSYLCSTITTATSANVAPQFCLVFHSQIFAGSPAEPASDKFNPNQMAHSSFSRMTNLRSSPQSQLPQPTN